MKISFIGLGKLGLPCAEAVAQKGHTVSGYDIVEVTSDHIQVKHYIPQTDRNTFLMIIRCAPVASRYRGIWLNV